MDDNGFSRSYPTLRLAWDATTLAAYMRDPLSYYWHYVEGYGSTTPSSPLVWGTLWHEVTASYKEVRANGFDRDQALLMAMTIALKLAKEVGLEEIAAYGRKTDRKTRNTYTLIRTLIWWEDHYADDEYKLVVGPEDKPLIETHFAIPLDMKAWTGDDYVLCGNMDEIVEDEEGYQYVLERKHTTRTLSSYYFSQYDPNVQIYTYDLVGSLLLPNNPLRGVVIEAAQTAVGFARFDRHEVVRTSEQRDHWLQVVRYWIKRAEQDTWQGTWKNAMNPASNTYDNIWKDIQRRTPAHWKGLLESELEKKPLWLPHKAKRT